MKAIWATGLMILTVLAGSALAGDGPCSPDRFFKDATGQWWDKGYINHKPEYEEIAPRRPDTPRDRIVERNGKVLRICAGSAPRFNEAEYRRYREANP
jgi:hypothetical protein